MTKEDILKLRGTAEQTRIQFKERVNRDNKYDFVQSKEFVVTVERRNVGGNDRDDRVKTLVSSGFNNVGQLCNDRDENDEKNRKFRFFYQTDKLLQPRCFLF